MLLTFEERILTIMTPQKLPLLIKISLILLFTSACNLANAQVDKDTLLAAQYFKKGDSLLNNKKYDQSLRSFKEALVIYDKNNIKEKKATCYSKIGKVYFNQNDYPKSIESFEKALTFFSNTNKKGIYGLFESNLYLGRMFNITGNFDNALKHYLDALKISQNNYGETNKNTLIVYSDLAIVYRRKGFLNKAIHYNEKALPIWIELLGENHPNIAILYNNIGSILMNKGAYDKALDYFQKALPIFSGIENGKTSVNTLIVLTNIGDIYNYKHQYESALVHYKNSLAITLELYGELHEETSRIYNNLGVVMNAKGDSKKALQYYKKSADIVEKLYGSNYQSLGTTYMNIGMIYANQDIKNYELGLQYCLKGARILEKSNKESIHLSEAYHNIGFIYHLQKKYPLSLNFFEKAISNERKYRTKNNYQIIDSFLGLGNVFYDQRKYLVALKYYNKAYRENLIEKSNLTTSKKYYSSQYALSILSKEAITYLSLFKEQNNFDHLKKSIEKYTETEKLIGLSKRSIDNHKDKFDFAGNAKGVFAKFIEAQLLNSKIKKEKDGPLLKVFNLAEKSKASVLKEIVNDINAKKFSELPKNILELEKELRINHSFYQSQIAKENKNHIIDSTKLNAFENELFYINTRQDSLSKKIYDDYPKYHLLKYDNHVISVEDVQQKLDDKTTLLEFFTTDSITYAFTISKNNFTVKELSTPGLNDQIEAYRKAITSKNTQNFKTLSHTLHQLLIAPVKDQLDGNQLIIVPDGPLWHLNFDLLLTQNDPSNNPKNFAYLLKEYAISYANSATLLFNTPTTKGTNKTLQECLAFSFSDSTKTNDSAMVSLATLRDTEDDLPGTREEIRAISNIIDGQYFYGSQAIETNFKKNAEKYNILHLALHGEVDNERPENSRLFFTKSKDSLEDNLLYSHELFALDIPAELTVLSACNTGTGKIAKGEGIMSLGNAFQYAGTKSLLLTSWEVSDQTTPELMKYFYTNLKQGMPKSKALQQAKLSYLQSADVNRTHPFYWGAFYLVGEDTPIAFVNNWSWYWGVGIGVLVLLLGVYFIYQRRSKKPHIQA